MTILHFDDIVTFNYVFCDLIAHLTFQMRKVLVIRNSNQTTKHSGGGGGGGSTAGAGGETTFI